MNDDHVVVEIEYRQTGNGISALNGNLSSIRDAAEKAARGSADSFSTHFGNNFFASISQAATRHFGIIGQAAERTASQVIAASNRGMSAQQQAATNLLSSLKTYESQLGKVARLEEQLLKVRQGLSNRKADLTAGLETRFAGQGVTPAFLKQVAEAQHLGDTVRRNELLLSKGLSSDFTGEILRANDAFYKLERNGAQALSRIENKLGASTKELNTLEQAALKSAAGMEEIGVAGAGAFAGLGGPIAVATAAILATVAAVGLLVAGMYALTNQAADYSEEIFKASKNTGFSTESLSAFKQASEEAGVDFKTVTNSISIFEKNVSMAARGYGNLGKVFLAAGVDLQKAAKDPETAYIHLIETLDKTGISANKFTAIQQLLGKGGKELNAVVERLNGNFAEYQKQAEAMGLIIHEKDAEAFHEFKLAIDDAHDALSGLVIMAGKEFAPEFTRILREIQNLLEDNQEAIHRLAKGGVNSLKDLESEVYGAGVSMQWLRKHTSDFALALQPVLGLMLKSEKISGDLSSANHDLGDSFGYIGDTALEAINPVLGLTSALLRYFRSLDTRGERIGEMGGDNLSDPLGLSGRGNLNDFDLPDKTAKVHKQKTELQKLQEEYKKLTAEIRSLQNVGSKEFDLRFKVEDLKAFKSDLESILKLRHELSLPLNTPLPATAAEAQKVTRELQRELEVQKQLRDLQDAQKKADDDLKVAQIANTLAVVDAVTRAQTIYLRNIRSRADAEKQLTAELAIEIRKREEAQMNSSRDIQQIQAEAVRDTLREQQSATEDLMRAVARSQVQRSSDPLSAFKGNALIGEALDTASALSRTPLQISLDDANRWLGKIEENTRSLNPQASRATVQPLPFPNPQTTEEYEANARIAGANFQIGINNYRGAMRGGRGAASVIAGGVTTSTPRRIQDLGAWRNERRDRARSIGFEQEVFNVAGAFPANMSPEQIRAAANEINRQTERRTQLIQEQANIEIEARESNIRLLNQQTIGLDKLNEKRELEITNVNRLARNTRLLNDLRDPQSQAHALELQRFSIELQEKEIEQERQLIRLREQSSRGYLTDPNFVRRAQNDAEISRLQAAQERATRIISLEDAVAHAGEDAADRYRIAWLEAIREVQDADVKAVEDQIRAQVKLNDATTVHTQQIRALVLQHLADQKTISEGIAEGINAVYDKALARVNAGIDHFTEKLGIAGDLLNSIFKSLAAQLANKLTQRLLDVMFPDPTRDAGIGGDLISQGINATLGNQTAHAARVSTMQVQAATVVINGGVIAGGSGGMMQNGGGGGNVITQVLGQVFGGGSSTTHSATLGGGGGSWGSFARLLGFPSAGGLGTPPTFPPASGSQRGLGGIFSNLTSNLKNFFGQNAGAGGLFAKGSFGFGNSAFAGMLPMLGLSLGAQAGGGGLGSILGGAGGLLGAIGLIGPSAVGLSATSFLAPLFSNPITAVIGGALLIGGIIYGISAKRKKNEQIRAQAINDTLSQLKDLLKRVQTDQLDGNSAISQAQNLREQYIQAMNQISDSKTRRIALQEVGLRIDPLISQIQAAAEEQSRRQTILDKQIPTFDSGGRYSVADGISITGYRSGMIGTRLTNHGEDKYLGMFRDGEVFLTREHVSALGGAPAMRRAGVRGFAGGGGFTSSAPPPPANSSTSGGDRIIIVPILVNEEMANSLHSLVDENVAIAPVVSHIQHTGASGIVSLIGSELFRNS